MKVIFFGTSEFAVPTLQALINSKHEVQLVITQPDRKSGRGLKVEPSPVKTLSLQHSIKIAQPEKLDSAIYKGLSVDIGVALAYGKIINKIILDHPANGVLGVHPSLLPKYRGAAPVNWALLNGEDETGMTIFKLDEHMDSGDIAMQKTVSITPDDNAQTMLVSLAKLGASMLVETIEKIEKGKQAFTPQDKSKVSMAPKLNKEQSRIDWNKPAIEIENQIRAFTPWPSTVTIWKGLPLKICEARSLSMNTSKIPGEVIGVEPHSLIVSTGKGTLHITEVQLPGKNRMQVGDFLKGTPISIGEVFGK